MRLKPRWIVLALGLAVALWALSGYYQWLRDKAAAESLARAMKLAVEQFSPPFAEFSQQNRRPPKDNQELGLAPPRDAHWQGSGFERVELFPNGDVHFEFRLARQHPDAPLVLFVWRIQPRNYLGDGAVVCGARGIPDQVMAWNGLRCDSDVAEPDPKLTAIMLTPALPERAAAATDPLYAALGRDDAAALQALRAAGADLCAHAPDGQTPLAAAVRGNQAKSLGVLIEAGCRLDEIEPASQRTPLMIAVAARDLELSRRLLTLGADPKIVGSAGDSAWFLAGLEADELSLQLRGMLLIKGAELNATDTDGRSLLMRAAAAGKLPLLDWLFARSARAGIQDREGRTALMLAVQAPAAEPALALLAARGADSLALRDAQGLNALGHAQAITDDARRERVIRVLQAAGAR